MARAKQQQQPQPLVVDGYRTTVRDALTAAAVALRVALEKNQSLIEFGHTPDIRAAAEQQRPHLARMLAEAEAARNWWGVDAPCA